MNAPQDPSTIGAQGEGASGEEAGHLPGAGAGDGEPSAASQSQLHPPRPALTDFTVRRVEDALPPRREPPSPYVAPGSPYVGQELDPVDVLADAVREIFGELPIIARVELKHPEEIAAEMLSGLAHRGWRLQRAEPPALTLQEIADNAARWREEQGRG